MGSRFVSFELIDELLVRAECFGPEPVEVCPQRSDPIRIKLVDATCADRVVSYQSCRLEHLEVL